MITNVAAAGGAVMMQAAAAGLVYGDLRPGLFMDFVGYIDRGERTTQTYINNLRQFAAWLAYSGITQPERQDIINYRDFLGGEHDAIKLDREAPAGWSYRTDRSGRRIRTKCSPATTAQYLRSVKAFFSWAAATGHYPNIAANIHPPKIRTGHHKRDALRPVDVLAIERSIAAGTAARELRAGQEKKDTAGRIARAHEQGARLNAMYQLAVTAGLRTVELSRARLADLEVKSGQAVLYVWGKGHTEPDTPKYIAPQVYQAIQAYIAVRSDNPTAGSPLFCSTGNRSGGRPLAPATISRILKRAMQEAGYNSRRITAHTLRHTAGTNVQALTNNLYLTQRYMRHASPATTEIYLHNDTSRAEAETAQRLYDLYHGIEDQTPGMKRLEDALGRLDPDQVDRIADIAAAMAR